MLTGAVVVSKTPWGRALRAGCARRAALAAGTMDDNQRRSQRATGCAPF